ncbi:hypothetical protein H7992_14485 [Sporosarcina sp. resist]|uniref:hypothetical protein n=1 Tax=Sporosarcina sp. resist TaxID=2762563 RepID=UPI00164D5B71|nr:hypothetical protein [Sporosarcina sp. resist]QNK86467.1 hypothetical protein H7992_14485 [Sporosarcina sp. resist]
MNIDKEREYVLLSWKWCWDKDHLVFWGHQTADEEKRSYGGYTMDVEGCEKYTEQELIESHHRFWGSQRMHELDREGTYAIKLSDLLKFGQKKTIIYK